MWRKERRIAEHQIRALRNITRHPVFNPPHVFLEDAPGAGWQRSFKVVFAVTR